MTTNDDTGSAPPNVTEFDGLYCEGCESTEQQALRCGEVTAWLNLCRGCWNSLPRTDHWDIEGGGH